MEPLHGRDRLLKEVITRAVTSPLSLFLATGGVLMTASPHTWPLGIGLLLAEGAWVWSRIRDPRHAQDSSEDLLRQRWRDLIARLEELSGVLDRDTSAALAAIVESQERLLSLYDSEIRAVPHTRVELTSLLQHCLSLAEKRHQLQTYSLSFSRQDVQHEIAQIEQRLAQSASPATRQLFEQALEQKRQELENFARLEEAIERIDGQLTVVQCTFDNTLSKIVRLQTADRVNAQDASDAVLEELNQLTARVAALESSLSETLTLRG